MTTKAQRIAVQMDTIKAFGKGQYKAKDKIVLIDSNDIKNSIQHTSYLSSKEIEYLLGKQDIAPKYDKTEILIFNQDSLEVGLLLQEQGYDPGVLNMASYKHPGGGYQNGAGAQEESLFRRTCLHLCLDGPKKKVFYPIGIDCAIYTKNVPVIRRSESLDYEFMENYKKISIISCPAYKCMDGDEYTDKIRKIMKYKLELVLQTGIYYGHDSVVLGAFGCGAYHNPATVIAEICKELIAQYQGYFKCIAFAILNDHNSETNGELYGYTEGNLELFSKVLGVPVVKI